MPKLTPEQETEFLKLYHQGLSSAEICRIMNVRISTIRDYRVESGLPSFAKTKYVQPRSFTDDELREAHAEGLTSKQAADKFGLADRSLVNRVRKRLGLPPFSGGERQARPGWERVDSKLVKMYDDEGLTASQIAERLGTTKRTIVKKRAKLRAEAGLPIPPSKIYPQETRDRALELLEDGASYEEVGRTLDIPAKRIRSWHPGMGWTMSQTAEYRHMKNALDRLDNPNLPKL